VVVVVGPELDLDLEGFFFPSSGRDTRHDGYHTALMDGIMKDGDDVDGE
jgi:hypothetical protein